MQTAHDQKYISENEYLSQEFTREIKHELIDGEIFAMAGASINHERISTNISSEFRNHLKDSTCEPLGSDMKVKAALNFYYPDVIVDCEFDENTPYFTTTPKIIIEVLSRSTRRTDETIKRIAYLNIPSLQEYVLIEQDIVDIEVIRRSENWQSRHYFMGDEVTFESIDLTLPVEEVYHRVQNEDVIEYLQHKELQTSQP